MWCHQRFVSALHEWAQRPAREWFAVCIGILCFGFGSLLRAQPLTPQQRAWVAAHPVVRVAYDPSYPPIEFEDASGQPVGLAPDHLRWVAGHVGLKLERVPAKSWEEALELVRARKADLLTNVTPLPERASFLAFSRAWMDLPEAILTRKDRPWIGNQNGLAGRRVAVIKGYSSREYLVKHQPTALLMDVPDVESALKEVSFGTVDAAVMDLASASWLIDQRGITNLRVSGEMESPAAVTLACRSDWPELRDILDAGLAAMPKETRQTLRERWVTLTPSRWRPSPRAMALFAVGAALLVVGLVLVWNRSLRTRVNAATAEIRGQKEALQELNRQQQELMGILAHDLRNPVTGIALAAELLQDEETLESVRNTARKIQKATSSLITLLNQFLKLQAFESGHVAVLPEPVVARALIQEAVDAFEPQVRRKDQSIDLDAAEELSVIADPVLFREVVDNLVSNALKYSPKGARIEIRLRDHAPWIRLEVEDEGPGLSAEDRNRLFQRFARLSARPTGGESSIGLGLSIAKGMVEAMGGRIGADGEPSKGSTFWLELPKAGFAEPVDEIRPA